MIEQSIFTNITVVITLLISVAIPFFILFMSRKYKKADNERAELLVIGNKIGSHLSKIEDKIDAHIVWHLNGDAK